MHQPARGQQRISAIGTISGDREGFCGCLEPVLGDGDRRVVGAEGVLRARDDAVGAERECRRVVEVRPVAPVSGEGGTARRAAPLARRAAESAGAGTHESRTHGGSGGVGHLNRPARDYTQPSVLDQGKKILGGGGRRLRGLQLRPRAAGERAGGRAGGGQPALRRAGEPARRPPRAVGGGLDERRRRARLASAGTWTTCSTCPPITATGARWPTRWPTMSTTRSPR